MGFVCKRTECLPCSLNIKQEQELEQEEISKLNEYKNNTKNTNRILTTTYLVGHRNALYPAPTGIYPKSEYGHLPFHIPDIAWYTDLAPNED